ncbi:MAG: TlpA disulfide reductase family protein [Deltaproteobacteria bacterium]|jgi:peroxiredoxin|nr:TlpA disulfide reductase family protein [Deltaproteobacteria bacterium]
MKKLLLLSMVGCLSLFVFSCGQAPTVLKVGDSAPDFSLVDRLGKSWTLSELKGQVVFINFWATWCSPCLKELPSMQTLFASLPNDKFKMLAVLNNDKPVLADFVAKQKGITIPILDDSQNLIGSKYDITGLPETFILDKQGIIREKIIGPAQWDTPEALQMIMKYINQ